ncbi:MAG: hypothetical protein RSF83_07815 [Hungatella sp.]
MNFEDLYQSYQLLEKELKDRMVVLSKLQKSIGKDMEDGDLKSFSKDMEAMQAASGEQTRILSEIKQLEEAFDSKKYFEEGSFVEQMLSYCKENAVDVKGEFPIYEMFPYKIRFDSENQDIYIDKKRLPCTRPASFVKKVKVGQDKLLRASFNAQTFANELAEVYDLDALKRGKPADGDLYLVNLYKLLAPMGRFRKDYDQQSYAFDLARLYSSGIREIKDGRHLQFGPSRMGSKSIRILDLNGREQYLSTIRFYS